jgi:hypothetical protein
LPARRSEDNLSANRFGFLAMATVPQIPLPQDAIARAREHLEHAKALLPHVGFDAGTTLYLVEMALDDLQALMITRARGESLPDRD